MHGRMILVNGFSVHYENSKLNFGAFFIRQNICFLPQCCLVKLNKLQLNSSGMKFQ